MRHPSDEVQRVAHSVGLHEGFHKCKTLVKGLRVTHHQRFEGIERTGCKTLEQEFSGFAGNSAQHAPVVRLVVQLSGPNLDSPGTCRAVDKVDDNSHRSRRSLSCETASLSEASSVVEVFFRADGLNRDAGLNAVVVGDLFEELERCADTNGLLVRGEDGQCRQLAARTLSPYFLALQSGDSQCPNYGTCFVEQVHWMLRYHSAKLTK